MNSDNPTPNVTEFRERGLDDPDTLEEANFHFAKVEDGLYLGSRFIVEHHSFVKKMKFSHILTVDASPVRHLESQFGDLKWKFLFAYDKESFDLLSHFEETYAFIAEGQQEGHSCFVHCTAGISRSATIVIAFLMKKYRIPFVEALKRVKEKRDLVYPNRGFQLQLQLYERMKWTLDYRDVQYRFYSVAVLNSKMAKDLDPDIVLGYFEKRFENTDASEEDLIKFRCKMCRRVLFDSSSIVPHIESVPLGLIPLYWEEMLASSPKGTLCEKSLFIEPQPWMNLDHISKQKGQLNCPRCTAKLGSFSWGGFPCECGTRVSSGFFINKNRLDTVPSASVLQKLQNRQEST